MGVGDKKWHHNFGQAIDPFKVIYPGKGGKVPNIELSPYQPYSPNQATGEAALDAQLAELQKQVEMMMAQAQNIAESDLGMGGYGEPWAQKFSQKKWEEIREVQQQIRDLEATRPQVQAQDANARAVAQHQQGMQDIQGTYRSQAADAQNRAAPTMDWSQANAAQQQQQSVLDLLRQRAEGTAPSPAEIQLMSALDRQQAQALGTAASQHGMAPGLAMRQALAAQTQMGQQASADAAAMRAAEANNAIGMMGNVSGQMRDQAMNQQYMGADVQLRQSALNDALTAMFEGMGYDAQKSGFLAQLQITEMQRAAYERERDREIAVQGANQGAEIQNINLQRQREAQTANTIMGLAQLGSSFYSAPAAAATKGLSNTGGGGSPNYQLSMPEFGSSYGS